MKKTNLIDGVVVLAFIFGISFTSCKSSNAPSGPAKTDPSTIATTDLVAYFPFNGNGNDSITGLTPFTSPNVSYVNAKRKSGFQGANNAYFLYNLPGNSKLRTLKAFTVAMWLNLPQAPNGVDPVPLIMQIKNDSDLFWGNLSFTQDRMGTLTAPVDSMNLKFVFHQEGYGNKFDGFANPAYQASKWMHVIFEYDNVTSTYSVFVGGVKLNIFDPTNVTIKNGTNLLGDLKFNAASQLVFGGWLPKIQKGATDTWMGWFTGTMDELRIYDRALTPVEAKALYDAEVTQLNP